MLELLRSRRQTEDCGLYFDQAFHSYREILSAAARQAGSLTEGSVVVLVGENSLELVQALLAAWWAGCTPVCLPPPARLQKGDLYEDFLRSCLDHVGATGGWCGRPPAAAPTRPLARTPDTFR